MRVQLHTQNMMLALIHLLFLVLSWINSPTLPAYHAQGLHKDTLITHTIAGHAVDVRIPAGKVKGNIIVLPGWSFAKDDWCKQTVLCAEALKHGSCLILPEMGKSVYSGAFYPETMKDWEKFPAKAWILKDMIPTIQQKYQVLLGSQKNFILGLSTGGRGVALIALAKPELFTASAALSGDFDQSLMPTDRLMIGYYGTYTQFKSRWEGEDNPTKQAKHWKTPIYLGHGKKDNIVPVAQTQVFYNALKKHHPKLRIKLNLPDASHDYAYWNSEIDNMLQFFEEFL
jgi:hypothetical protein